MRGYLVTLRNGDPIETGNLRRLVKLMTGKTETLRPSLRQIIKGIETRPLSVTSANGGKSVIVSSVSPGDLAGQCYLFRSDDNTID